MIQEATILDLSDIVELMEETEKTDCHAYVHMSLLNPTYHWFYKKDSCMIYEPMDNGRYNMHIYNRAKGDKSLRNWCLRTGLWIFENTEAKVLLNFVKIERKDLRFFMASLGAKRVAKIDDEILYKFSREDKDKVEERLKR